MTERKRSQIQTAEISFLHRVVRHSLRNKVIALSPGRGLGSSASAWKEPTDVASAYLGCILRHFPGYVFQAGPSVRRPRILERLSLGISLKDLEEVSEVREVGASKMPAHNLGLCNVAEGGWMDGLPNSQEDHPNFHTVKTQKNYNVIIYCLQNFKSDMLSSLGTTGF